jgi:SRSO17 transposase
MRAAAAGDPGPGRQQAILGRGRWDADTLRDIVRDGACPGESRGHRTPGGQGRRAVVDETGFLKQGKASCRVGRHCTALPA